LVANYRLIVPDLPGHGGSAPEAGPLSIGTVLAGTAALLDNVAPGKPAILVGNSLGAWIGMVLALEKPERVARLVIINGGGSKGERPDLTLTPANREEARQLMTALRDPGSPFIPDFVLDDVIRQSKSGPIGRLASAAVEMEKYLLDNRLQELEVPVDLVWGESDRLFSVDYARRMLAQLPAARLTIIPRCGHVPQQECPDKFREELVKILHQEPPSSVP
jgi:pimeloyl-ACP methyl ester carboxylesterase